MNQIFYRIYYTKRCKQCLGLLNVILNEGIQNMFILICVDQLSKNQLIRLSSQLDTFPTIIISNDTTTRAFIGAQECSQWLNTFIQNRRMNIMQRVASQRRLMSRNQYLEKIKNDGVGEYNEEEMSGISDTYTFNTNIDLGHAKNFIPVGQEESYNIVTPQNRFNKLNYKDIKSKLNDIEKERDLDTKKINDFLEKEQVRAVLTRSNNYN